MIKEVEMYTVICDGCGKDSNAGEDYSCWGDRHFALECAFEANWLEDEDNDKHYCPDCYDYDDEGKVILKNSIKTE